MLLYISGPMSGLPESNFPAFREAAKQLTAAGYDVIDPSENFGGEKGRPRKEYMRKDIEHVLKADGLAMLDGWLDSAGAALESEIAYELHLPTYPVGYWLNSARAGRVVNAGGQDYTKESA